MRINNVNHFPFGDLVMKKEEITIGGTYMAKVNGNEVPVRIESENSHGGWDAKNIATGRTCRIKTAQRLRRACNEADLGAFAQNVKPNRRAKSPTRSDSARKAAVRRKTQQGEQRAPVEPKATVATTSGTDRDTAKPRASGAKASGLTAAAMVLATNPEKEMRAKEIVEQAAELGLWESRAATPHATVYSAIIREIKTKGEKSRFRRGEAKGAFATNLSTAQRKELLGEG